MLACASETLQHLATFSTVVFARVPSSFLLLVVGPGAPSSVLAPSSDALCSQ